MEFAFCDNVYSFHVHCVWQIMCEWMSYRVEPLFTAEWLEASKSILLNRNLSSEIEKDGENVQQGFCIALCSFTYLSSYMRSGECCTKWMQKELFFNLQRSKLVLLNRNLSPEVQKYKENVQQSFCLALCNFYLIWVLTCVLVSSAQNKCRRHCFWINRPVFKWPRAVSFSAWRINVETMCVPECNYPSSWHLIEAERSEPVGNK